MGYLSRKPTSNDMPRGGKSPWGGNEFLDDTALLISGHGERCDGCKRVTQNQHLENNLCPDCRENPDEIPDIFKPEYMNLYELVGYIKAHLEDLWKGTASERCKKWGIAWITELILRLKEIQRELSRGLVKTLLSWSFILALIKILKESGFAEKQELKSLRQASQAVKKIICSFQKFLGNQTKDNKHLPQLALFCKTLYQEMPFQDRYGPGRLTMEIKLPPSPRRAPRQNFMADGQPGEAD